LPIRKRCAGLEAKKGQSPFTPYYQRREPVIDEALKQVFLLGVSTRQSGHGLREWASYGPPCRTNGVGRTSCAIWRTNSKHRFVPQKLSTHNWQAHRLVRLPSRLIGLILVHHLKLPKLCSFFQSESFRLSGLQLPKTEPVDHYSTKRKIQELKLSVAG
jgi:hypothetical protein